MAEKKERDTEAREARRETGMGEDSYSRETRSSQRTPTRRSRENMPAQPLDFWRDDSMLFPFSPLSRRVLRDFFSPTRMPGEFSQMGMMDFPRVDIADTKDEIKVTAEMAGVDPETIDIEAHDRHLHLSGQINDERENDERGYRYERMYGEFDRTIMLPEPVQDTGISAEYENGVLTLRLPKQKRRSEKVRVTNKSSGHQK